MTNEENFLKIKNDLISKIESYKEQDIIEDGLDILERIFTPPGANSQIGDISEWNTFKRIHISYGKEEELFNDIFNYFAILKRGYFSLITHYQTQSSVWWMRGYEKLI